MINTTTTESEADDTIVTDIDQPLTATTNKTITDGDEAGATGTGIDVMNLGEQII